MAAPWSEHVVVGDCATSDYILRSALGLIFSEYVVHSAASLLSHSAHGRRSHQYDFATVASAHYSLSPSLGAAKAPSI